MVSPESVNQRRTDSTLAKRTNNDLQNTTRLLPLVPPLVAANVNYNLRNSHNIHVPFNRVCLQNSYFPCTIQAWNSLDLTIRNLPTFSSFKLKLQQIFYTRRRNPQYYSIGDRFLSVLHSRMRNKCRFISCKFNCKL